MEKPKKVGRPPLDKGKAKGLVLALRLTPEQLRQVDKAAAKARVNRSVYARELLLASLPKS